MSRIEKNETILKNIDAAEEYPVSFEELEAAAKKKMHANPFGYIQSGAGGEQTLRANTAALEKYSYIPRLLRDVSEGDLSV